jgi:hypothetical protein
MAASSLSAQTGEATGRWALHVNSLVVATNSTPIQFGTGATVGLAYSKPVSPLHACWASLGFRTQVGYPYQAWDEKITNEPGFHQRTFTTLHIGSLYYTDVEVGWSKQWREGAPWSWSLSGRLAVLTRWKAFGRESIITDTSDGGGGISNSILPNVALAATHFRPLDVGFHLQVFRRLNDRIRLQGGLYQGFISPFQDTLFLQRVNYLHTNIAVGFTCLLGKTNQ